MYSLIRVKFSSQNRKKSSCSTENEASLFFSFTVYASHILNVQNSAFQRQNMNHAVLHYCSTAFLNAVDVKHNEWKGEEVLSPEGCKTNLILVRQVESSPSEVLCSRKT